MELRSYVPELSIQESPERSGAQPCRASTDGLDKEGILPLIAFYNSFAGEQAPDMAVEGLALKLGEEFIKRDLKDAATEGI
jgi:hypothetical protein